MCKISMCPADVSTIQEAMMIFSAFSRFSFIQYLDDPGAEVQIKMDYCGKPLKRWGDHLDISIRDGRIVKNNLVELAWSNYEVLAKKEADYAIVYFARLILDNPSLCKIYAEIILKDHGRFTMEKNSSLHGAKDDDVR